MNLKFLRFSDEFFRCAYTRRNLAKFCLTFYLHTRGSGLLQGDLRFPGHLLWIGRFLRLKSIVVRCVHERGKVRLRFLAAFWERKKTGHRMRKSPVNNGGFLSLQQNVVLHLRCWTCYQYITICLKKQERDNRP